jgi:predicted transcriptional regulator
MINPLGKLWVPPLLVPFPFILLVERTFLTPCLVNLMSLYNIHSAPIEISLSPNRTPLIFESVSVEGDDKMLDSLDPSSLLPLNQHIERLAFSISYASMVKVTCPIIQSRIRELHKHGMGRNAIARELYVSPKVVTKYLGLRKIRATRVITKKLGRKTLLTPGIILKARNYMKKNKVRTSRMLASGIGLQCSKDTALKLLHKMKCQRTRGKKRTPLTEFSRTRRLNFAFEHVSDVEQWERTVFSDEKRFCLQGPDSYRYSWYLPGTAPKMEEQTERYKESFMVWGAIGKNYKSPLYVFETTEDSDLYIHMLAVHFFPDVLKRFRDGFCFIQDNAPPHRAADTQEYLMLKNCTVLTWPPYSPDLNCIENMWSLLSAGVYDERPSYNTLAELKTAVLRAWDAIPLSKVNALIDSMTSRLRATIKQDGGHTAY